MKLLIISDIDDLHWRGGTGRADLLLSLGDIANRTILEAAKAYNCSRKSKGQVICISCK